jgi:hypothetical protein
MLKGNCHCEAISVQVVGDINQQPESCHCSVCRKLSGHFMAAVNIHRDNLKIKGEESIQWYQSSEKVSRGFCKNCGTHLFWKPKLDDYAYTAVLMGIFDAPTGLKLSKHAFIGDKGDYYEISDHLPQSNEY